MIDPIPLVLGLAVLGCAVFYARQGSPAGVMFNGILGGLLIVLALLGVLETIHYNAKADQPIADCNKE